MSRLPTELRPGVRVVVRGGAVAVGRTGTVLRTDQRLADFLTGWYGEYDLPADRAAECFAGELAEHGDERWPVVRLDPWPEAPAGLTVAIPPDALDVIAGVCN